jgi:hypothetical protein
MGQGDSDVKSLLAFSFAALCVTVGACLWIGHGMGQGPAQPTAKRSFQAVEAIPEGEERTCPTCDGKKRIRCTVCGGHGLVRYLNTGVGVCYECNGSGITTCTLCRGKGKITSEQRPGSLKWNGTKKPSRPAAGGPGG